MTTLRTALFVAFATTMLLTCTDETQPSSPADVSSDELDVVDEAADTVEEPDWIDLGTQDDSLNDLPDALSEPEMGVPRCSSPPDEPPAPTGPYPEPASPYRGIDALEQAAYAQLRDAVLADPGVHFIAAWDAERDAYVVDSGPAEARNTLVFRRVLDPDGGMDFEILEGTVESIFPNTAVELFGSYDELLGAFENPNAVDLTAKGYEADDARVGFLPPARQSYPLPLLRLAALFDAPDAPDAVGGVYPWAYPSTGTHGAIALLQSRSTLILSGAGAREGVVLDDVALLADVAPTTLAALGAPTTGGIGPDGTYDNGLYLQRQDGRVLWEALVEDPCDRPDHVVILLFDGLLATEINHQTLDDEPDVTLPTFTELARAGAVYRYGAVTNFPSVSAPGHVTSGTGVWSGHHNVMDNAFFTRSDQSVLNPADLFSNLNYYLEHPEEVIALYEQIMAPGVENLAAAAHRAFGPYNPLTGEGAFVAVVNELTFLGADFSTLDLVGDQKGLGQYRAADNVAAYQVVDLLGDPEEPVPTILQVSFLSTDGAGESDGPHSPLLREVAREMDRKIAEIRRAYDQRGALEDTLFILISDHGMELQDPSRGSNFRTLVNNSGVRISHLGSGPVYIRTLEILAELDLANDELLTVTVVNHDNDDPVEEAFVTCAGCEQEGGTTGADGVVYFGVPMEIGAVELTAAHPEFNEQTLIWIRE